MSSGAGDVFLHVGLPKTGTKYLQRTMQQSADALEAERVELVPRTRVETTGLFRVARGDADPDEESAYSLDDYARDVGRAGGASVLTSDERLARLTHDQAEQLLQAVGDDRRVHLVLTLRAISRALPSAWQQDVKVGKTRDLETYVTYLRDDWDHEREAGFWIGRDLPDLFGRWAPAVPAERIHICTVPATGDSPTDLLDRFCAAVGVSADGLRAPDAPVNSSLGLAQTEVLRRINELLPEEFTRRTSFEQRTGWHVRLDWLGRQHLATQPVGAVRLPGHWREWTERIAADEIAFLSGAGVQVHGDLEDLRPRDADFTDRPETSPPEVLDVTVQALADIVLERAAHQEQRRRRRDRTAERAEAPEPEPVVEAPEPTLATPAEPSPTSEPASEPTGRRVLRSATSRLLRRPRSSSADD